MYYMSKEEAILLYDSLMQKFGGERGIFGEILDQCLEIPSQHLYGKEVYPTVPDKAAAYLYFCVTLHPFTDGNKRFGYAITRIFLLMNDYDFSANKNALYDFVMNIAKEKETIDTVKEWMSRNTKK